MQDNTQEGRMTCTRCENTGFLNLHQVDEETMKRFESTGDVNVILDWIKTHEDHDVQVCDCCGDGTDWHGKPGHHYETSADFSGKDGPYAYNGGLAECN